jgi:hypothetical protein
VVVERSVVGLGSDRVNEQTRAQKRRNLLRRGPTFAQDILKGREIYSLFVPL